MKYTFCDYREAVNEAGCQPLDSTAFRVAQMKANSIAAALLQNGDRQMAREIFDDLENQFDCAAELSDEGVQMDLWLLESNGFNELAARARKMFEEV